MKGRKYVRGAVEEDIHYNTVDSLAAEVISSTLASMVSTLHDFGDNLPDFREFDKVDAFDGGEYIPPSQYLSDDVSTDSKDEDRRFTNIQIDRYGFFIPTSDSKLPRNSMLSTKDSGKEMYRITKWEEMMTNWDVETLKNAARVKERVRKGIPNSIRPRAWPMLLRIEERKKTLSMMTVQRSIVDLRRQVIDEIDRDVNRTFPTHSRFRRNGGEGQLALRKVLLWYAAYDTEIGYCQGMAFVAATLLIYMNAEDTFYCIVCMMESPITSDGSSVTVKMRELYTAGLVRIQKMMKVFNGLGQRYLPKIWKHFQKEGVEVAMFVSRWFMTLYCRDFSFDLVARVMDNFVHGDYKIIYRVGLGLLKQCEKHICNSPFDEIMRMLQEDLPHRVNAHELMDTTVWSIRLKSKDIELLEQESEQI